MTGSKQFGGGSTGLILRVYDIIRQGRQIDFEC